MDTHEAFNIYVKLEEMMSECYAEINKICDDKSISKELIELSKEETDHVNLLKWGKDYLNELQNTSVCKFERPAELSLMQEKIGQLINNIQEKKTGLVEAINDVIVLERIMEQFYLRRIAEVNKPSLKKLFDLLSISGREHIKSLMRIMQSLNPSNLSTSSTKDSAKSNSLKNFCEDTFFGKKNVNPKCIQTPSTRKPGLSKQSH
jgi:rubrerythrin